MRNCIKRLTGFALMAALLLVAAVAIPSIGCGDSQSQGGTFTYAESNDPPTLDPALAEETVGGNIDRYLFDGLIRYDSKTSEVQPAVAESWDTNEDATVFTFHLRSGVKFSDGSDVTAEDFVYSWTRALTPETQSSMAQEIFQPVMGAAAVANGQAKSISGVEAVDSHTLKVTLERPMADFVSLLGHPVASPVLKKAVEDKTVNFAEQPTGDGPFMVKSWTHDDSIVLVKNPNYYGDAGSLDTVTVKIIPNPATAIAELKAGNVDAVRKVPAGQTDSLRSDSAVKFFQGASDSVHYLAFDITKAPFDNPKVREAFAAAIDRDTIANKVLQGQESPADGLVPTSVPGHQTGALTINFDPEKAKSLLAEAGFPGGSGLPAITLNYPGAGTAADAAQAIQWQLKSVGVPIEINGVDPGVFGEQMGGNSFSLFLVAWQGDAPNIDSYLFPLFASENIGATNVFQYNNPVVDQLLVDARSNTDADARTGIYNDAERKIIADWPAVPVTFGQQTMVYAPRVSSFVVTPLGDIALTDIAVSNK
ncbi:MAG: peptide ABC transporter substrate-binding protein [Thermoleophilia bacterium]